MAWRNDRRKGHCSLTHNSICSPFIPSRYWKMSFFFNPIFVNGPPFSGRAHTFKPSPWIPAPRRSSFPRISPFPDSGYKGTGCSPPSFHGLCREFPTSWSAMKCPQGRFGLAASPMQTAGRHGSAGLNTSPVNLSLKGKHLLPREPFYFTLLQGSALDMSTDCFGAKLEKIH